MGFRRFMFRGVTKRATNGTLPAPPWTCAGCGCWASRRLRLARGPPAGGARGPARRSTGAGPPTERAGPGGEPAHVVAGQDDHGEVEPGLRLELLDEGTAQRGLLVEEDRLQAELHEEARDLLLHLPVPPVHDEHLAFRSRLRTGARRIGIEDAGAEPELLRHRLELAELRLQILALIRYARRVAEAHARVDGPEVLVELVRHEEEPEQLARAVLPGAVGVVRLVVPAGLETPHQLPAPADVIEQEPGAASVSGELGAKRRAWKLGHGTSPERRRLWRAWGDPCLRRAKAMRVRRGGSPAPLGAAGCRAAVPEGSHGVRNFPQTYKPVRQGASKPEHAGDHRRQPVAVLQRHLDQRHVGPPPDLRDERPARACNRPEHRDRRIERRPHGRGEAG